MQTVWSDFRDRVNEVETYINFVADIADHRLDLEPNPSEGGVALSLDQTDLVIKILKANSFLLLYNLVESTTKNSIQAIYDEFKSIGVSYDGCRDEVRRIAIKNIKKEKLGLDYVWPRILVVAEHILTEPFEKDSVLPGNVDDVSLRKLAKEYGFLAPRVRQDKFRDVKDNRNSLAHGNKTFNEVGRDYTPAEIIFIKDQVKHYLIKFIDNVEFYVNGKLYLASPPPPLVAQVAGVVKPAQVAVPVIASSGK